MGFIKYKFKKVASVDEKVFSFLASCQRLHNLNISAIDFCTVMYWIWLHYLTNKELTYSLAMPEYTLTNLCSFVASCQMLHNLNISAIDFCNVLYTYLWLHYLTNKELTYLLDTDVSVLCQSLVDHNLLLIAVSKLSLCLHLTKSAKNL